MAEIYVRHSLNSHKAVKFNFTFKQFTLKGKSGDSKWVLEVGTTHPAADGSVVPTKVIYDVKEATLDQEIEKAVSELCSYIDWGELEDDNRSPSVSYVFPEGTDVSIKSLVEFELKEKLPSSGIDLSDMVVTLDNGSVTFDITEQVTITGDPYTYKVIWDNPLN